MLRAARQIESPRDQGGGPLGRRLGLLAVTVGLALTAGGARGALQFDVFLGYEGITREACWVPVVFEIKNDGPSFKGVIELISDPYRRGQTTRLPIELPTGTLKRVVMPTFVSGRYGNVWDARLLDERGKARVEQPTLRPRRQVSWETLVVASLPRTAAGLVTFPPGWGGSEESRPAAVRMQPAIFPDNPIVLQGLDAIYLSSEVAATLSEGQAAALVGWMRAGGHLIVGVEQVSDVTALPWLRAILPCEPRELRVLGEHAALHRWVEGEPSVHGGFTELSKDAAFERAELPVLVGSVRGGTVVVAAQEVPLVVSAPRNAGRVTALLFSPEREPARSWKHLPWFWARLLSGSVSLPERSGTARSFGSESADGIFGAMIDTRQVKKLPVGWLLALLGVYLVVIGPFDRWWLRRLGKPMLTWITFPGYVVGFSLLIYFIGHQLRSGETESNELNIVDVLGAGERAEWRGRTYASIYTPRNARFPLESREAFAALRGEFGAWSGEAGMSRATVWQRGESFAAEVFVPVWTSQLFVSDWWRRAPAPLEVEVVGEGEHWRVTVRNGTQSALQNIHLAVADRIISLGDMEAGQTRVFRVARLGGMELREFLTRRGGTLFAAAQHRRHAFGLAEGGWITDLPNASIAASFVGKLGAQVGPRFIVPAGLDLSGVVERGGAVLLAWADNGAPAPPLNRAPARRGARYTLWRVPVETREAK